MVVYTSETGKAHGEFVGPVFLGMPQVREDWYEEYCFICRRCTDHSGEHDNAVTEYTTWQVENVTHHNVYVKPDIKFED